MKKKTLLTLVFIGFVLSTWAQTTQLNNKKFKVYEDSLKTFGFQTVNGENELVRRNATYSFIKTLVRALKLPGSFNYPFDSLKTISILKDPKNTFRIFSWPVAVGTNEYRFYGAIQMNNAEKLELYPLTDYSELIQKPGDTITDNKKWYGAQYYSIIPPIAANDPYVLLGWKGNNNKTTKRIIEALRFIDGKPVFGFPIFQNEAGEFKHRIIFEYSRQASMMLKYVPSEKMIVFDHLIPPAENMQGKYEFYGPDLSYDGIQYNEGKWKFRSNLKLSNDESESDALYNDPKKLAQPSTIQRQPAKKKN
ncbi:hypothetical protein [Solitalea koreensis]|nr:hypothetical protein [Solitalea koreensis]